MSTILTEAGFAASFPRLSRLVPSKSLAARSAEFEGLGLGPMWQIERDLELLARHVSEDSLSAAYRNVIRNPGHLIEALYEIRVASMLAPVSSGLTLAPAIGERRSDVQCVIDSRRLFFEVTAYVDKWPPADGEMYSRATVERSFDPTERPDELRYRDIPASKEVRDRISGKARQLRTGELNIVVLGAPNTQSRDVEAALLGDEYVLASREGIDSRRSPNGIFAIDDALGGMSRITALVWLKLRPAFGDVQVQSRLISNPRAAVPLPAEIEAVLVRSFDRQRQLQCEVRRITRILIDDYHPERLMLFGSLAAAMRDGRDWVHEWSDIDLAIVKRTASRFSERVGEVLRLVQPRAALNVVVYTPEEFEAARREGAFFVGDEILQRGVQLYP